MSQMAHSPGTVDHREVTGDGVRSPGHYEERQHEGDTMHTDNTRPPQGRTGLHTLTLSDPEAYQIWYLSRHNEGGDDYPSAQYRQNDEFERVTRFFSQETRARFMFLKDQGITPLQYLRQQRGGV